MDLRETIKQKAWKPFKTCYNCYEVQQGTVEGGIASAIPESCNDCKNFNDVVVIDDVLALLDNYKLIPKEKWQKIVKLIKNRPNLELLKQTECWIDAKEIEEYFKVLEAKVAELKEVAT